MPDEGETRRLTQKTTLADPSFARWQPVAPAGETLPDQPDALRFAVKQPQIGGRLSPGRLPDYFTSGAAATVPGGSQPRFFSHESAVFRSTAMPPIETATFSTQTPVRGISTVLPLS